MACVANGNQPDCGAYETALVNQEPSRLTLPIVSQKTCRGHFMPWTAHGARWAMLSR